MTEAQPASEALVPPAPSPGPTAPDEVKPGAEAKPAAPAPHRFGPWLLRLVILIIAAGLVLLLAFRWDVWVGERSRQTTDDAYVRGDITPLSAQVEGYVRRVPVRRFPARQGRRSAGRDRGRRLSGPSGAGRSRSARRRGRDREPEGAQSGAARADRRGGRRDRRDPGRCRAHPARGGRGSAPCWPPPSAPPQKVEQADCRREALRRDPGPQPGGARGAASADGGARHRRKRSCAPTPRQSRRSSIWPRSISAIPASPRRSTAWSASAACAPGNMSMPGRQVISVVPLDNVWVRRELQGNPAHPCRDRPARRDPRRHLPGNRRSTRWSTASRRRAARSSACCRRTTRPAISPRSCSASRSRLRIDPDNPLAGRLRPGHVGHRDDPHRHHAATAMTVTGDAWRQRRRRCPRSGRCEYPAVGVVAVMIGAFISTLNARLTTLGLADIRGALGLGFDEGSWISTIFSRRADGRDAGGGMDEHRAQHPPRAAVDRRDLCPGLAAAAARARLRHADRAAIRPRARGRRLHSRRARLRPAQPGRRNGGSGASPPTRSASSFRRISPARSRAGIRRPGIGNGSSGRTRR